MTDYYKRLHVDIGCSADEIKKAFRQLSKKYHPDLNAHAGAESTFKEIQEAYAVLSNTEKRRAYDVKLQNYRLVKSQRNRTGKIVLHLRYSNPQRTKKKAQKINVYFVMGGVFFLLTVTILISYLESKYDDSASITDTSNVIIEQKRADSLHLIEGFKPRNSNYKKRNHKE